MPKFATHVIVAFTLFLLPGLKRNKQTINDYSLYKTIEVKGIKDLSGITFNQSTGTYWLINNNPALILEINSQGKELRRISFREKIDTEDICWIENNTFAIVEETNNTLLIFDIRKDCQELSVIDAKYTWSAPGKFQGNKGLESVAYDHRKRSFLCASEKKPITFFEVSFVDGKLTGKEVLSEFPIQSIVRDVSGTAYFENQKVILSDDSNLLLFLDETDTLKGQLSLEFGLNGLKGDVEQAEGVCFQKDTLVIASEPNNIYFFNKNKFSFSKK